VEINYYYLQFYEIKPRQSLRIRRFDCVCELSTIFIVNAVQTIIALKLTEWEPATWTRQLYGPGPKRDGRVLRRAGTTVWPCSAARRPTPTSTGTRGPEQFGEFPDSFLQSWHLRLAQALPLRAHPHAGGVHRRQPGADALDHACAGLQPGDARGRSLPSKVGALQGGLGSLRVLGDGVRVTGRAEFDQPVTFSRMSTVGAAGLRPADPGSRQPFVFEADAGLALVSRSKRGPSKHSARIVIGRRACDAVVLGQ